MEPVYAGTAVGAAVAGAQTTAAGPSTPEPAAKKRRWPRLAGILGCLGFLLLPGIVGFFALTLYSQTSNPLILHEGVSAAPTLASQVVVENTEVPPEPSETATVSIPSSTPLPAPVPPVGSSKTYVQYIFDASGSMTEMLGGKTKLQIAQDVLTSRLKLLPPDINVGLRVYGHSRHWP